MIFILKRKWTDRRVFYRYEIIVLDDDGNKFEYNFKNMNYDIEQYKVFMRETGLFNLLEKHLVNNLYDYVLGVESGLNSNARKNRGGHVVERFIQKAGFKKNETYFKEMYLQDIEQKWKLDMSFISNKNTSTKRFDFVVKTDNCIYGIETNFYASGGSKLNETARSYKIMDKIEERLDKFNMKLIGEGSYANVYKYKDNLYDCAFAIKSLKKAITEKEKERFKHEFELLAKYNHPNILKAYKYIGFKRQ